MRGHVHPRQGRAARFEIARLLAPPAQVEADEDPLRGDRMGGLAAGPAAGSRRGLARRAVGEAAAVGDAVIADGAARRRRRSDVHRRQRKQPQEGGRHGFRGSSPMLIPARRLAAVKTPLPGVRRSPRSIES